MRWLTKDKVKQAALNGHKEALECSFKHWSQLYKATKTELREVMYSNADLLYFPYCALCMRYFDGGKIRGHKVSSKRGCGDCPLRPKDMVSGCRSGSLWYEARQAFENLSCRSKWTGAEWQIWKAAAKALKDTLESELKGQDAVPVPDFSK